jgi:hypothetical protein
MGQAAGAANTLQMPSPVNLSTVPSKRWTPSERIWKKRSMIRYHSSGSTFSPRSHRAFEIREEDRHLLPLAFERATGGQDLLDEMFRSVGAGIG